MKRLLLVALLFLLTGCGVWATETTGAVVPAGPPLDGSFNGTDVMFLQMAVPQHEEGIELAKLAEKRASRKEVRDLATAIRVTARRSRSFPEGTCSDAGMSWPLYSLSNTCSIVVSWESDRSRSASMPRSWRSSR